MTLHDSLIIVLTALTLAGSFIILYTMTKKQKQKLNYYFNFWGALRISDEGDPTMVGGDVPENFEN